ncbi:MAG: PASTA domain-containing protein [Proteobacteria bacterium]|nr:MAG: PASTA domain-containing protein [Pseudomonadota bacterium]
MILRLFIFAFFVLTSFESGWARNRNERPVGYEDYEKWPGEKTITSINGKLVVPRLVGRNYGALKGTSKWNDILSGFKVEVVGSVKNAAGKGIILTQDPKAGELVKRTGQIKITISNGESFPL